MKTKNLSEEIYITPESIQYGSIQYEWQIINELKSKYYGRVVRKTENVFEDMVWDYTKTDKDWLKLSFKSVIDRSRPVFALEFLIRLIGFHMSEGNTKKEYAVGTIASSLSKAKKAINWLISKNILVGKENQYLKSPAQLTPQDFKLFFDKIAPKHSSSGFMENVRILKIWHELSINQRLSGFLSLTCDPFDGKTITAIWDSYAHLREKHLNDDSGWLPIPLNYAFRMVNRALKIIDERDIFFDIYEKYIKIRVSLDDLNVSTPFYDLTQGTRKLLKHHPELFKNLPLDCYNKRGQCRISFIEKYLKKLQQSAIIILLITTGLRNWEVRDLKVQSCTPDPLFPGAYKLKARIKKTAREKTTGKIVSLPIPAITALAIEILEKLRPYDDHKKKFLISTLTRGGNKTAHKRAGKLFIDLNVKAFCKNSNIDYIPHPHQFRKTIAGWFAIHTKMATLLIMRLFSHESAAMAERYLFNNPLISEARLLLILETTQKLLNPLSDAIGNDQAEGPVAESIKKHPKFRGLTGEDLSQSLEELIIEQTGSGELSLLLTPTCICVSPRDSNYIPPCSKNNSVSSGGCLLDHEIQNFANTKPTPEKCKGAACDRALIIPMNLQNLSESMKFYKHVLQNSEYAKNIYLINEAKAFIETHTPILERLA